MNTSIETIETTRTLPKIKDKTLEKYTNRIYTLNAKIGCELLEIAHILATIRDTKLYEKAGYSTLDKYAKELFGYSKSWCFKLATIGSRYIELNGVKYQSIFALDDGKDFTHSQLVAFAECNNDKAIHELIESGDITTETPVRKILAMFNEETTEETTEEATEEATEEDKPTLSDFTKMYKAIMNGIEDKETHSLFLKLRANMKKITEA